MNIPLSQVFKKSNQNFSNIEELLEHIKASFEVEKREVYFLGSIRNPETDEFPYINYPEQSVIVRTDNETPLSVVGSRYEIVQYKDALSFINEIVNLNEANLFDGFTVDNGARIFVILKAKESINFNGAEDSIESYFTVSSSHDGTNSLNVMATPIHSATQTIITPLNRGHIKLRHTVNVKNKMFEAKNIINKVRNYFSENIVKFQDMASVKLDFSMLKGYLNQVFPGDSTRTENIRAKVEDIFKTNKTINGLASCNNTLLGAYVAILQYCDYYGVLRESSKKTPSEMRIEASLVGSAAKTKAEGFSEALVILKNLGI